MGRVARYKKVKSIDPFAKHGSWKSDVGDCATLKRVRHKSKTSLKMKEQKMNKLQQRTRGKKKEDDDVVGRRGGGSNGWGDDEGYDLPPEGGDEFDMNDLMGSVKKQRRNKAMSLLLEDDATTKKLLTPVSSYTKVSSANGHVTKKDNNVSPPSQAKINVSKKKLDNAPYDGTTAITAKTSTREIIASCSNPTPSKKQNGSTIDDATNMKQEKRKAFFEKKKLKKKIKRGGIYDDDDDDDDNTNKHVYNVSSSTDIEKKTEIKKNSDTIVARTVAFDIQVERPPTFTMLPRGANKLDKNKKMKMSTGGREEGINNINDAETVTAQRIRKEKQDMEAMRERVMRQYAILRESRRK